MTATAGDDAYPNPAGFISLTVNGEPVNPAEYGAITWLPVSNEVRADMFQRNEVVVRMEDPFDRFLRPWRYRDRNPMPTLVPFPRLARAQRRAAEVLQRARDAYDVLRHGLPETDW